MESRQDSESGGKRIWKAIWQYKWLYFWMLMACLFGVFIYFWQGASQAIDYFSGYLIELSLSVDNLFVFLLIFISFGIKEHAQHKVLNYGIAGTIVLRFLFIFVGISLINMFEWLLWVFGALLVFSGVKMFRKEDEEDDPRDGVLYKIIAKFLPMSADFEGEKFIVKNDGTNYDKSSLLSKRAKTLCTPLMVVMVLLLFSDIIFAIDSVPAVISMTRDLFIVYTSNMFAVMGLRQMFFVLEHMHERFQYVKYGVAVILIFTGVKMLLDIFDIQIPNLVSIAVILVLLIASVIASVIVSSRTKASDLADRLEKKKEIEDAFEEAEKEE
ncbi:MAG: TerC/Alx family metal homeostasis membrane protein [Clostridiales bacterium]|nr:TerC/Alx family metal homeostasis membrane protein [Clostridiales bacterium]